MIARKRSTHQCAGFTLIEMLASMTVLLILLGIIAVATQGTSLAVHQATGKLSTYAAARAGFSTMNAKLAQATLNTYLDYYGTSALSATLGLRTVNNASTFVPVNFGRVSELQFLVQQNLDSGSGQEVYFQCPNAYSSNASFQSTQGLLNACGYYVKYDSDANFQPHLLVATLRWRYRLMQAIEPTENLQVYAAGSASTDTSSTWTKNILNTGSGIPLPSPFATPPSYALPLADNVIALIVWPRLPVEQDPTGIKLAPNYIYDSQKNVNVFTSGYQPLTANQLPPVVQVTMVVIDEASAARLDAQNTARTTTPPTAIKTALSSGSKFTDVTQYATDLGNLEASLAANHIRFEVLNASIVMRSSKWSGQ